MKTATLFYSYAMWHYSAAFADLLRLYGNTVWFIWHFFSIPVLIKTFFSPWRRLEGEEKSRFGNFVINISMRAAGVMLRSAVIFAGLIVIAVSVPLAFIFLIIWVAMPAVLISVLIFGIFSLFVSS